jgi:enoyl-CoA hydratase/carnithine racemase
MPEERVLVAETPTMTVVKLNREKQRNALSRDMER